MTICSIMRFTVIGLLLPSSFAAVLYRRPRSALLTLRGGQWGDSQWPSYPSPSSPGQGTGQQQASQPAFGQRPPLLPHDPPAVPGTAWGGHVPGPPSRLPELEGAYGRPGAEDAHQRMHTMPPYQPYGQPPPVAAELRRVRSRPSARGTPELDPSCLPGLTAAQARLLREPAAAAAMLTSFSAVGETSSLHQKLSLPFGALLQPLASNPPQVLPATPSGVDYGGSQPTLVRCGECKAYINPYVKLFSHSTKWECNMCGGMNDLPPPVMTHPQQSHSGGGMFGGFWGAGGAQASPAPTPEQRLDLRSAEVEYVLSDVEAQAYTSMKHSQGPCIVLAIEVTPESKANGMLRAACEAASATLAALASEENGRRSRVAVITYSDHVCLHQFAQDGSPVSLILPASEDFPVLPGSGSAPLFNLTEHLDSLQQLLETIADGRALPKCATKGASLTAAVHTAVQLLAGRPGRMCIFSVTGSSVGPGACTRQLSTSEGEEGDINLERLMRAENQVIRDSAHRCAEAQLSVSLLLAPQRADSFQDLASLSLLPKCTGGVLTRLNPESNGAAKFQSDLSEAMRDALLPATAATDAVLRLRCSRGLTAKRTLATVGDAASADVITLPSVDSQSTFGFELAHDEKGPKPLKGECAYLQAALLFTSADGRRRIRVLTRQLRVVNDLQALVQSVHPPALLALRAKLACLDFERRAAKDITEQIQDECVDSLVAQRTFCPPPLKKTPDELILHRSLELLPLMYFSLVRLPAFSSLTARRLTPDEASLQLYHLQRLPGHHACLMLMPRVYIVHQRSEGDGWAKGPGGQQKDADTESADQVHEMPMPSMSQVSPEAIYLMDSWQGLTLWVGAQSSPSFLDALFGTKQPADEAALQPSESNEHAARLHRLVGTLAETRSGILPLRVLVQGSPAQYLFFSRLAAEGYCAFASHLHSKTVPKL